MLSFIFNNRQSYSRQFYCSNAALLVFSYTQNFKQIIIKLSCKHHLKIRSEKNCHLEEAAMRTRAFSNATASANLGKVAGRSLHVGVSCVQSIASLIVISQTAILSQSRQRYQIFSFPLLLPSIFHCFFI